MDRGLAPIQVITPAQSSHEVILATVSEFSIRERELTLENSDFFTFALSIFRDVQKVPAEYLVENNWYHSVSEVLRWPSFVGCLSTHSITLSYSQLLKLKIRLSKWRSFLDLRQIPNRGRKDILERLRWIIY
jgi:hypothetical protein